MTTPDFIIALFYAVDQEMLDVPKHPEAKLYPSEVVTLALLHAIKGGGTRAFYRWLTRDYLPLFPQVPERTRLAWLFKTHRLPGRIREIFGGSLAMAHQRRRRLSFTRASNELIR